MAFLSSNWSDLLIPAYVLPLPPSPSCELESWTRNTDGGYLWIGYDRNEINGLEGGGEGTEELERGGPR